MEIINEVDFEIVKEFINLPLDSLKQFLDQTMEEEGTIQISGTEIVSATVSGVEDGSIGIDVECTGGINGHLMYFFSYAECEKLAIIKNRNEYNAVSDDDKYEYVMDSTRKFINDISVNLANTYRMLIDCDVIVGHVEAFSVSRASDFYSSTFETDEQVVTVNGSMNMNDGQSVEFKQLISSELAKSIVDMFYNADIKLPSQTPTLGDSFPDAPVSSSSDDFTVGNSDMSNFINEKLDEARPEPVSNFSDDISSIISSVPATETPISESVEHISAPKASGNLDLIMSVPVEVSVEVGRTKKRIKEILDFKKGTLVELDRVAGEPMDIYVNGKCIAKGEVVVIEDKFGVRITKIMKTNNIFD